MQLFQIQKYFDLLPKDKVPKIGSIGERYRIKQLTYQLPKQDIDYNYCKHLGQNRDVFEEFINARNEIALDIGIYNSLIKKQVNIFLLVI